MKPTEPKKILCIHDLSGMGRCSLAVILPVLSVMGCQPVALPTVVLSTHTGGLGTPARLDGAAYGLAALKHYRELGVEFDCIYTGYLGGEEQVALAEKAFDLWPAARKVVDPVMGDNGKAYSTVTPALIDRMRGLCRRADLILPNATEAALLLEREPQTDAFDDASAQALADELLTLRGVRASFVLFKHDTGVNLSARSLGEINVQFIMEKLGGGGNRAAAAAQINGLTLEQAVQKLYAAIDEYIDS